MERISYQHSFLSSETFKAAIDDFPIDLNLLEDPKTVILKSDSSDTVFIYREKVWIITTNTLSNDSCDEIAKQFYAEFSDLEDFTLYAHEQIGEYVASYFSKKKQKSFERKLVSGNIVEINVRSY